ncbi:MAG: hypothetical protein J6I68_15265 [Butyrivibrio sp.]|uniref:phage distal tail protein domain-containing protein n=1 Tax=Butyrivibrio sp. TaxID=28121 RepID=UPI001B497184|nr:hypothetical protein [Butyrivibrio sp.]MBP3784604.1 hypothetical protein [Butyrivibrio sp.]
MRKFYLRNGNGAMYSFMSTTHWFNEPKGLGLNMGDKYSQVGLNFVRTKKLSKPKDIEGTLVFTGNDQYSNYYSFAMFAQVEPLTFIYNPNGTEYMVDVHLKELGKGEINPDTGWLEADISFKKLSPWYRVVRQRNDGQTVGKVYDYQYPYKYGKDVANNVTMISDTALESPCKITIIGTCINPIWRLYVNGVLKSTGRVITTLTQGQRIVIDTTVIPYSIKKYDNQNNLITDLYQYSDFSTERFFFLERGTNRISIGHDGVNTLELAVEAHLEYETV